MKTRIIVWTVIATLMLLLYNVILGWKLGTRLWYVLMILYASLPILFCGCIAAIHIAIGWFVWQDAKKRNDLLLRIPAWVWGLTGLTGGFLGLLIHWMANCCLLVKRQTIQSTTQQSAGGDGIPPPQP